MRVQVKKVFRNTAKNGNEFVKVQDSTGHYYLSWKPEHWELLKEGMEVEVSTEQKGGFTNILEVACVEKLGEKTTNSIVPNGRDDKILHMSALKSALELAKLLVETKEYQGKDIKQTVYDLANEYIEWINK